MTHLFISYSHKDNEILKEFVQKLENVGFNVSGENKDIWIDNSGIEGGEDWRSEIDLALEESFAVVILLTKNSLKSPFVLYEWTWALGNSTKVIPILVENIEKKNLPRQFKHPLFDRKQHKNWNIQNEQEYIINQLLDLRESSPFDRFIGYTLNEILLPMRFLTRLTLWSYPYGDKGIIEIKDFQYIAERARQETDSCTNKTLRNFWLSYSPTLNRKQKKLYAKLSKQTHDYSEVFEVIAYVTQLGFPLTIPFLENRTLAATTVIEKIVEKHQTDLDETIEKLRASSLKYNSFDSYLQLISKKNFVVSPGKVGSLLSLCYADLENLSDKDIRMSEKIIDTIAISILNRE